MYSVFEHIDEPVPISDNPVNAKSSPNVELAGFESDTAVFCRHRQTLHSMVRVTVDNLNFCALIDT